MKFISTLSFVILPGILIAKPGPGKGCLERIVFGSNSCAPNLLTSSLNKVLSGSTKTIFIFFGNPPTL